MSQGLGVCVATLEAATEHEMRVVVGRSQIENNAELGFGLGEPLDPKIGDAERLADRRLAWLVSPGLLERNGRLRTQTVPEMLLALLEVAVCVSHRTLTIGNGLVSLFQTTRARRCL